MTGDVDPQTRVRRAPTAAWREIDGQVAIVSTDVNRVRLLNAVGGFVWHRCDGASVAELTAAVGAAFAVDPAVAAADVGRFVTDLAARGMVALERP